MEEIINRVADSGIKTIDLEKLIPTGMRSEIDIKELLFQGLVLREKEFRQFIKDRDWETYRDHFVNVTCSADAIVPNWAYMLIATQLSSIAARVIFGDKNALETQLLLDEIEALDLSEYKDERVIIKGCSDKAIAEKAYLNLTLRLTPVVNSLMFGEPCSAVPVYKKKKGAA
jgi:hypothetical protein